MKLKQLEEQLEQSLEAYRSEVVYIVDSFHSMDEADREYFLPEALDNMNRQVFYTFYEFQENIIKYLKGLEKR